MRESAAYNWSSVHFETKRSTQSFCDTSYEPHKIKNDLTIRNHVDFGYWRCTSSIEKPASLKTHMERHSGIRSDCVLNASCAKRFLQADHPPRAILETKYAIGFAWIVNSNGSRHVRNTRDVPRSASNPRGSTLFAIYWIVSTGIDTKNMHSSVNFWVVCGFPKKSTLFSVWNRRAEILNKKRCTWWLYGGTFFAKATI